jgi:hypothetical protein
MANRVYGFRKELQGHSPGRPGEVSGTRLGSRTEGMRIAVALVTSLPE